MLPADCVKLDNDIFRMSDVFAAWADRSHQDFAFFSLQTCSMMSLSNFTGITYRL